MTALTIIDVIIKWWIEYHAQLGPAHRPFGKRDVLGWLKRGLNLDNMILTRMNLLQIVRVSVRKRTLVGCIADGQTITPSGGLQ